VRRPLRVSFRLEGDLGRLRIPGRRLPRFRQGLWRHTCFEVFVAREGSHTYREYNLSPSGEWAVYAFSGYRVRRREKAARPRLRGRSLGIGDRGRLRIGLAAVIEESDGALSYWALRHPPGRPDFHHPRAFALRA
jgi:hypothetical protein